MTRTPLMLGAFAALAIAVGGAGAIAAQAPSPANDPDRPSTPGKSPPAPSARVMGGTVRNGNGATQEESPAATGQGSDASARAAMDARRLDCARNPPAPDTKAWRACREVGAEPPR